MPLRSPRSLTMSTPNSTLRQRPGKEKTKGLGSEDTKSNDALNKAFLEARQGQLKEWDYKVGLGVITVLAFITRFFGISHPNEVVFDEVHFGKVRQPLSLFQQSMAVAVSALSC